MNDNDLMTMKEYQEQLIGEPGAQVDAHYTNRVLEEVNNRYDTRDLIFDAQNELMLPDWAWRELDEWYDETHPEAA
jgi:hypothetical protein